MSDNSTIEWTDATWNPSRGCTKISPGCKHCYACTFAERFRGVKGNPYEQGFDLRLVPEKLKLPLAWKKPRLIFVNSMSDLFHEGVPDEYIVRVAEIMLQGDWHIYQVLTKRSKRMRNLLNSKLAEAAKAPHIWWGVSAEDRKYGLPRIAHLQDAEAAVRFVSAEPLLEDLGEIDLAGIHWLIVGGESGHGARPFDLNWGRSLIRECKRQQVACFVKQLGRRPQSGEDLLKLKSVMGGDWLEWPEDVRVRNYPSIVQSVSASLFSSTTHVEAAWVESEPSLEASNETPATLPITETVIEATCVAATQVASVTTMTCAQLREYVRHRSVRCNAHAEAYRRRWTELYPALLEVEARYDKQQGARTDLHDLKEPGFHEFLISVGVAPGTFRSWKSRVGTAMKQLKEITDLSGPDSNGKSDKSGLPRKSRRSASASTPVAQAAANLAEAKAKLGPLAELGNSQAKAYIAEYEQIHAKAVSEAEASEADAASDCQSKSDAKITKRLAAIVEASEKYIRLMERVVYSEAVNLTDRQRKDIQKAAESWRKLLRDARQLSWAIKTMERQEDVA